MRVFVAFAVFSILLFGLFLLKRTYVAQLLSPGLHAPLGLSEPFFGNIEKLEDMRMWMAPY